MFGLTIFIFAMIAFLVAIGCTLGGMASRYDKGTYFGSAGGFAAVGVLLVLASSLSQVPARNVGIVESFGKPTGRTTGPGLKWHAPWESISDWDASRQAFDARNEKTCVQVRIADLSNACVEVLVEWNTRASNAPEQWASYKKEFSNFTNRRVDPNISGALNEVFSTHDPLANVDKATGNLNVPLAPLATAVKAKLTEKIGADIEVLNVIITRINYNEKTQGNIDAFRDAVVKGRTLDQEKINAEKQKLVTEINAKVDRQTRCLDLAERLNKEPGYCMWTNGFPAGVTR